MKIIAVLILLAAVYIAWLVLTADDCNTSDPGEYTAACRVEP